MSERVALRFTEAGGRLHDVVVQDVEMFRAEMLTDKELWLACYLPGTGVEGDRITFRVSVEGGRLAFAVEESPAGTFLNGND